MCYTNGKLGLIRPAANRRLAQWRVKWLIEHSTLHQLLWCMDILVLPCLPAGREIRHCAKRQNVTGNPMTKVQTLNGQTIIETTGRHINLTADFFPTRQPNASCYIFLPTRIF